MSILGVAFLSGPIIGLAAGAEFDVIPYFTSRYVGLRSFSKIYGVVYAVFFWAQD